jgi:hypothetical protein
VLARPVGAIERADAWLGRLHARWESRWRGAAIPDFDQAEMLALLTQSNGQLHVVDTATEDPGGYFFRFWGSAIQLNRFANYQGVRLAEVPHNALREIALRSYRGAVATARPAYDWMHVTTGTFARGYARLILPLAADGRTVDRLIVAINQRDIPELGDAAA